ncbi:MAG: ABC transporter ATP-binding protein [Planctomycetota bacterium]
MSEWHRFEWARFRLTRRVFGRLQPWVRPHRKTLLLATVVLLAGVATDIARPWPIKLVVDQVILAQPLSWLPDWLAGNEHRIRLLTASCATLLILAALGGILAYWKTVLLAGTGQRVVARMRDSLHNRLLRMSLAFHGKHRSGDLLVRLTGDASMMNMLLIEGIFALGEEALMVGAVLLVMLLLDPVLGLVAGLVLPAVGLLMLFYGGRLKVAARKQRRKEGQIAAAVGESLEAVPVIQAYSLESVAAERFARRNKKSLKAGLAATRLEGAMSRWTEVALAGGTAVILLFGTHRVLQGRLSAGELIVLISYVRTLYKPLRRVVTRTARLIKASACGERILEILEAPIDLPEPAKPRVLTRARGDITFENVSFEYEPGRVALADINLEIAAGQRIGIAGRNGAGKSTLVSLVPRLRDPTQGKVRLDGHDLREFELRSLRQQVAYVFQRTALFDGTLLENIWLGRPEARQEEVLAVAQRAGVAQFAATLPDGLQTLVGEGGAALSGGQRQRISVARALLRDAPIVILDEFATSLDPEAEALVTRELLEWLEGRTLLLIAHKPESLELTDEVIVLEQGRIAARGRMSDLVLHHDLFPGTDFEHRHGPSPKVDSNA